MNSNNHIHYANPSVASNLKYKYDENKFNTMIADIEQILIMINKGKPLTEQCIIELSKKIDSNTDEEQKSAIDLAIQTQKLLK